MGALTVTSKGQVTLRRDVLKHLGVQRGDKVAVEKLPGGRLEIRAMRPTGRISDVFDLFKRRNRPALTIGQIDKIAKVGWTGRR